MTPAYDIEAEKQLLGCVLIDNILAAVAEEHLTADDFYSPRHGVIWRHIIRLLRRDIAADITTIRSELISEKNVNVNEYEVYLLELTSDRLPTLSNVETYARIVANLARMRRARATIEHLDVVVPSECEEAMDSFEAAVMANANKRSERQEAKTIGDIIPDVFAEIERASAEGREFIGLSTGLIELDRILCGLKSGQLIIVAGRPGMGKSAFASGIVVRTAMARVPVLVYSLEMDRHQWVIRILSGDSGVDSKRMQNGRLTSEEWTSLTNSGNTLHDLPLIVNDSSNITVMSVRSKCRRLAIERGALGLVVVDYLQLMRSGYKRDSREQDVAEISRSLKALARELKCPIIAIAQLNRDCEKRIDKRPTLGDLRESGALEQDADVVLMLYREEMYDDKPEHQGLAEVIVSKNRMGGTGKVACKYTKHLTRFDNLERVNHGEYSDDRFQD